MSGKPFALGVIVGRFQPLHVGHGMMMDKAAALCDKVCVFVGSSQESGTNKNPLSYEKRKRLLQKICKDGVYIYPLPDIGVGNTPAWGEYVLNSAAEKFGMTPDLLVTGREERRAGWLDCEAGAGTAQLFIPKTVDITASRMRGYLANGDRESWKKFTDKRLWDEFEDLRRAVLSSQGNTKTDSV